jgi:cytochrome c oxidase subunit 2
MFVNGASPVLIGFLAAAAAILVVMAAVARTTIEPPEAQAAVTSTGYRLRKGWLWALGAAAVVALAISLPSFPYGKPATLAGKHFTVIASQYSFELPQAVPAGTNVIFDVTSRDVNHGFGIYDPRGRLVAQVQAMPDYVNHLPLRFGVKGHYLVRCLEYCGIAHAAMQGAFEVR